MSDMREGLEREVKYAVLSPCGPEAFPWGSIGLQCSRAGRIVTEAVYWDTPVLSLYRLHASVRYRTHDGWTMKEAAGSEGAFTVRRELVFPGGPDGMPQDIRDRLSTGGFTGELEVVARLSTTREVFHLAAEDGAVLAELVCDEVRVPEVPGARFMELEVEMKGGDTRLEEDIVSILDHEDAIARESRSKLTHALEILGRLAP